jgi:hypothetical protein
VLYVCIAYTSILLLARLTIISGNPLQCQYFEADVHPIDGIIAERKGR